MGEMKNYCKLLLRKSEGEGTMKETTQVTWDVKMDIRKLFGVDTIIQDGVQLNESVGTTFGCD
jgi:hypothetical protein